MPSSYFVRAFVCEKKEKKKKEGNSLSHFKSETIVPLLYPVKRAVFPSQNKGLFPSAKRRSIFTRNTRRERKSVFSPFLLVCASGKVLSAGEKLYLEKSLVAVCAHAGFESGGKSEPKSEKRK